VVDTTAFFVPSKEEEEEEEDEEEEDAGSAPSPLSTSSCSSLCSFAALLILALPNCFINTSLCF
jgi:hypothetical protein